MTHTVEYTFGFFILSIVYIILLLLSIYCAILYRRAYLEMKKTRMIQSVMLLMFAITFDSAYWMTVTLSHAFAENIGNVLLNGYFATIPKFLLLCAVAYFLYATLTPTRYVDTVDQAKSVAQKTSEVKKQWQKNKN